MLARADKKPMFNRLPAWLTLKSGTVVVVPERAAAVKRIFVLAATGYGQTRIVAALIAEVQRTRGRRRLRLAGGRARDL